MFLLGDGQVQSAIHDQAVAIEKEKEMLDLINRVQMFQIASSKVNQNLLARKKLPVFNLQFMEALRGHGEDASSAGEIEELDSQHQFSAATGKAAAALTNSHTEQSVLQAQKSNQ